MELGHRQRHDRVARHRPDGPQQQDALLALLRRSVRGRGPPHRRPAERGGRERDPGPEPIAELAHEVLEGAAVAVPTDHHAPPMVVPEQLAPERRAVAYEHGVVPGDGHQRADEHGDPEPVDELRAPEPPPAPPEHQVRGEHDHRQAEPGEPLGEHGDPAQDRGQVEVERRPVAGAGHEPEHQREAEPVRDHRHHAVHGHVPTAPREHDAQLHRVDDQLRDDRDREQRGRAVAERVIGEAPEPPPAPRQRHVVVVEQGHRAERERHGHRPHERHVRHRLARDEAIHRRRGDHDRGEEARAA